MYLCCNSFDVYEMTIPICHWCLVIHFWLKVCILSHTRGVQRPPQSPDLNPIEHLWDVVEREIGIIDVQPTNLQQLRDAITSIWTKISEECF